MFRFTRKPSSGSHNQYLAKITGFVQCRHRRRTDVSVLRRHNTDNLCTTYCTETALIQQTVQPFTESDETRCCDNTIYPPEDGHVNAQNISRIVV
jgi:hypothetical protein